MAQPVFYLLAGPNGAGKSTLYRALALAGTIPTAAEFVNADLHWVFRTIVTGHSGDRDRYP